MKRPIHSADDGETLTITTQFGDEPAEQHPISATDLDQLEEGSPVVLSSWHEAVAELEDAERRYEALRVKTLRRLIVPATDTDHPAVRQQIEVATEIAAATDKSRSSLPKRLAHLEADLAGAGLLDRANRDADSIERRQTAGPLPYLRSNATSRRKQ